MVQAWILGGVRAGMSSERADGRESPIASGPDAAYPYGAGQLGAADHESSGGDEPTLPVAAVARRLGVAPATLRTWDRRYGLGPTGHTGGKHRRYGPIDVARLEVMQRALLSGASTAEAAKYALETVKSPDDAPEDLSASVPAQQTGREDDPGRWTPGAGARISGEERRSSDLVNSSQVARRLSAAALAMDARMTRNLIDEVIGTAGPVAAWEQVINPVLSAVGAGWRSARSGPEAEYLLTELALSALVRAAPVVSHPHNHHPVLLVPPPAERASLALYALAAGLAGRRIDPLVMGSALPLDVLASTVRRTAPAAVVLWARRPGAANPALFARLSRGRQRSRMFAGGPGWDRSSLPGTVEYLSGLAKAVERISYVLLGSPMRAR